MSLSLVSVQNSASFGAGSSNTGWDNITKIDNRVDNRIDNSITTTTNNNNTTIQQYPYLEPNAGSRKKILQWLSSQDFSHKHAYIAHQREPGTGLWLLKNPKFMDWRDGKISSLLCFGIPGAGKTILVSLLIDNLEATFKRNNLIGIAYIYCNYEEKQEQTAFNLTSNLLCQLMDAIKDGASPSYRAVASLYEKYTSQTSKGVSHITQPSQAELSNILRIAVVAFKRVFVIIDALDELMTTERNDFVTELRRLAAYNVSVLTTSRPIIEVGRLFNTEDNMHLQISACNQDIKRYLEHQIRLRENLSKMILKKRDLNQIIITKVLKKAQGMFLLARLYLEALEEARDFDDIHQTLACLPQKLYAIYDNITRRIAQQDSTTVEFAKKVLVWVVYAVRPLKITELQCALAVNDNEEELECEDYIVSSCAGLIMLDHESNRVRLVHYTVHDYFRHSNPEFLSGSSSPDLQIASTCLRYLSSTEIPPHTNVESTLQTLITYAAPYWGRHACVALTQTHDSDLKSKIMDLLRNENKLSLLAGYMESVHEPPKMQHGDFPATPLHVGAYYGLDEIVKELLTKQVENSMPSSHSGPVAYAPLHFAAIMGHEGVVRLLLEKGAPVDLRTSSLKTPLHLAAMKAHEGVVRLLLEKGAPVDLRTSSLETPLHLAAMKAHEGVVRLLLEKGASVDLKTSSLETPLHLAAAKGHEGVVQLLLGNGASVDSRDLVSSTPLHLAVMQEHKGVVRLLLGKGANVNLEDHIGNTPLHFAVYNGHDDVVRLLLENGASVGLEECTPLHMAVAHGGEGIVRLLLQKCANVDLRDGEGKTSLHSAAKNGYERIVRLLLEYGADVGKKNRDGETALALARKEGHEGVVSLLSKRARTF